MAGSRNALASVTNELQKNVAYALGCIALPSVRIGTCPLAAKTYVDKIQRSNMHFLGHSYADFLWKSVAPLGKHPALTLAGAKPYLQGAAAMEGFGSSSLLRTRWRSFFGSKKASKKIKIMPPSHEIEVKFRITDLSALTACLMSEGFRLITPRTHEMNTLYDQADSGLRNRGALLRLRQYGARWTVTYKDRPAVQGRHKMRREIETLVENGPALAQILEALGYQPRFSYEKFRTEWTDGSGHVVVDETPVGNFGEIEGAPEWIDEVAGRLNIAHDQYITLSYSELFAEWKQRTGSDAANMLFAS